MFYGFMVNFVNMCKNFPDAQMPQCRHADEVFGTLYVQNVNSPIYHLVLTFPLKASVKFWKFSY